MKSIKFLVAFLAGAVSLSASAEVAAFAVNGRLSLTGVDVEIDQLVVQRSADGATGWQTVEGFTKPLGDNHNDYAFGPDQDLSGVSYWRWSIDAGATWSDGVAVDAGSPVLFGTIIGSIANSCDVWYDGQWNTFADDWSWHSDGNWAGLDLKTPIGITRLVVVPRYYCSESFVGRAKKLSVEVSNDSNFAKKTTVYSRDGKDLPKEPLVIPLEGVAARFVRVVGVEGGNIAEFEVDYDPGMLPQIFTWSDNVTNSWMSDSWVAGLGDRTYPSQPGDVVEIGINSRLVLDADVAISGGTLDHTTIVGAEGGSHTLTIEPASEGQPVALALGSNRLSGSDNIRLGDGNSDDNLSVSLGGYIYANFPNTKGNTTSRLYFSGRLTGGTVEKPFTIDFSKSNTGWNYSEIYLMRNDNDFCGDFILHDGTGDSCSMSLRIGYGNSNATTWYDSALGDPSSRYFIYGPRSSLKLTMFDAEKGLCHQVLGNGQLHSSSYDSWGTASYRRLALDDGFVLSPCTESSEYASFTVVANPIEWREKAIYRVSVGFDGNGAPVSDQVTLDSRSAMTFGGTVEMVEDGEIPIGTAYTILTIPASAKSVTFAPAAVTAGWTLKFDGNADNGWTVVATKAREGADVSNYPATLIADDHVTANCEVTSMGAEASVAVRVYYGTTDGGDNPGSWDSYADYPAITEAGKYSIVLPGLTVGQKYYMHHAVMLNGVPQFTLDPPQPCDTVPVSKPDSFTWLCGEELWNFNGAWSINTPYERQTPGYAGDVINFNRSAEYPKQFVTLEDDRTIGGFIGRGGNWDAHYKVMFTSVSGATLTFDNLEESAGITINDSGLDDLKFGADGDSLVLCLASPLRFTRGSAFGCHVYFYAKLTGGTADAPVGIELCDNGNEYSDLQYHFCNADNDFVGDISLKKSDSRSQQVLHVGDSSHPYAESMLGNAANAVDTEAKSVVEIGAGVETAVWSRAISGLGSLKALSPLQLSDDASVTVPATGTFTLSAASGMTDDEGVRYRVNIDADDSEVAGQIAFATSGELALNGAFEILPDDPQFRIKTGTRWVVGSISDNVTELSSRFRSIGQFRVFAEANAEDGGWTIYAERRQAGLFVLVR